MCSPDIVYASDHRFRRLVSAMKDKTDVRLAWMVKNRDKEMRPIGIAIVAAKQFIVPKGGEFQPK